MLYAVIPYGFSIVLVDSGNMHGVLPIMHHDIVHAALLLALQMLLCIGIQPKIPQE